MKSIVVLIRIDAPEIFITLQHGGTAVDALRVYYLIGQESCAQNYDKALAYLWP